VRLADPDYSLVFNIFFVRELTKRLPANSPVIVNAVNPGYCKSHLSRNFTLLVRVLIKIVEPLLARTTEEGSRQLVWAAIGGGGREFELRGGYVDKASLQEVSDYVLSDEGAAMQTRIWVRDTFCHTRARNLNVYFRMNRLKSCHALNQTSRVMSVRSYLKIFLYSTWTLEWPHFHPRWFSDIIISAARDIFSDDSLVGGVTIRSTIPP